MWTVRIALLAIFVVQLAVLAVSLQSYSVVSHRLNEVELVLDEPRTTEAEANHRTQELVRALADAGRRVDELEADLQRFEQQLGKLAVRLHDQVEPGAEHSPAPASETAEHADSMTLGDDAARQDKTGPAP
ncbi:MAG TPA: hypothetical protein DDY14_07020 [Chromatiaceae bacterium]|jgi:septal ring factor EnvC (AmiA/AmiB activator)|nr:hypothetical protein [Chromatiaceae bacterium]